jgi:integrase/recombinase XerD
MSQAKTLTQQEIKQVLGIIALDKHAKRNRAMFLLTCWGGLRVGEVAQLRYCDVVDENHQVRNEIRLLPEQTKGNHARTVFINDRLLKELSHYAKELTINNITEPFFYTQKRKGFTANTLAQHFFWLYKKAGLNGASSHSGRRTFITTLASKGVSVRVLASLAGHANISTTQRYIDVNDDMKRQAIALI